MAKLAASWKSKFAFDLQRHRHLPTLFSLLLSSAISFLLRAASLFRRRWLAGARAGAVGDEGGETRGFHGAHGP